MSPMVAQAPSVLDGTPPQLCSLLRRGSPLWCHGHLPWAGTRHFHLCSLLCSMPPALAGCLQGPRHPGTKVRAGRHVAAGRRAPKQHQKWPGVLKGLFSSLVHCSPVITINYQPARVAPLHQTGLPSPWDRFREGWCPQPPVATGTSKKKVARTGHKPDQRHGQGVMHRDEQ